MSAVMMGEPQTERLPTERKPSQDLPVVLHARVVTGAGGGPEKTILNSPRFLPELGYQSVCAYLRPPEDTEFDALRKRAAHWQAPLLEVSDRGPFDRTILPQLLEICRTHQVKVWHAHDYKSNLLGLWLRRSWPMKLVTTLHGWVKHTWRTPLYYALDRLSLPWYERVICVSEDLRQAALRAGVRAERCELIHNAIDTEEFRRTRSPDEAKQKLGFNPERLLIGAVGRLSAEKGFDVLIRAVDQLIRSGQAVNLAIAGSGDEEGRLRQLIRELNLAEHVQLLGFRSDTLPLYEAFDLFALSSYREGLPNVVLEAMAMETPVVATAIAGLPQLIDDRRTGLLIPPGEVEALASALGGLCADPVRRGQLAKEARHVIEQRYSFRHRMQKVAAVYDDVLRKEPA